MGTTGYKAPNQADKIGRIKFTNAQLAAMMLLVDSPVWEILKIKYQSQRSVKIALTCLNAAIEDKDLWFYRGMDHQNSRFFAEIEKEVANYRQSIEPQKEADPTQGY